MGRSSADISPSTTKILSCIPQCVVKKLVAKCLPAVRIDWDAFAPDRFYASTIAEINKLPKCDAAEFYDVIRHVNDIAKHRENGRFILEQIIADQRFLDMSRDLDFPNEIAAMSAWVYCEVPPLWSRLAKRSAAAEVENYRTVTCWFGKPNATMSLEEGEKQFCQTLKDYLQRVSQPLKHVHLDRDDGDEVTRYIIHFDPYPQKVPTFDREESDELAMCLGTEAERFQVMVFHESRKLMLRCQFSTEQSNHIIALFLTYVLQADPVERPQSSFNVALFNDPAFGWSLAEDPDVIECRTYGIKFVINHPDGLVEEISHSRSSGDILEFIDSRYAADAPERLLRSILEVRIEVTIRSGRRPTCLEQNLDGTVNDPRQVKTIPVRITETGRHISCRNGLDKAKVEAFLDRNGLHDANHVVK